MKLQENMKHIFQRQSYLHLREPLFLCEDFKHLQKYLLTYVQALPEEISTGNFANDPEFSPRHGDWVRSRRLLDMVEFFLGPDIVLWSFGVCYKPPRSPYRVVAHTDSHFWIEWDILKPVEVLGLFIPMTDMSKANGCLRVLPEVNDPVLYRHKVMDRRYNFFGNEIEDERVDMSRMVDIEMKANEVLLTKENLIHASECNTGAEPRLGITLRFISGKTRYTQKGADGRRIFLLRGADHAGNTYADIGTLKPLGGFSDDIPS